MSEYSKIALVTGGSKGIGAGCVQELADAHTMVVIHYRSGEEDARKLADTLPHGDVIGGDLSQDGVCQQIVKEVVKRYGRIDILVNNAGVCIDQLVLLAKEDSFDQLVTTNLKSVFLMSKFASKTMLRKRWGRIINITSVVGHMGNPGQSIYSATKGAMTAFAKSMGSELAGAGITVNCVAPGFIKTAMTGKLSDEQRDALLQKVPMKRMGTPKDIGAAVGFLASETGAHITSSTIHVNGGMY